MLVLVSFGLVLLATILLIVGLFNDTLGLIYLSIAASVIAAIVLFLAFRMARPKAEKDRTAPEPIDPDGVEDEPTALQPVATVDDAEAEDPESDDDDVAVEDEPDVAVPAAVAAVSAPSSDDDWMDDEEWDDEVVDFPIADYDDLTVAEIMPLLPQLYSDELDLVIEREQAGRNRSTIIRRLEELKVSGTEADEVADPEVVVDDAAVDDGEDSAPDTPAVAAVSASVFDDDDEPAAAAESSTADDVDSDTDDDGDDQDEDFFPIADYDSLTVGQIMPLLDQLEPDELEDVRDRETAGAGRKTLLAEIERRLGGSPAPAPAPVKAATRPAKKAAAKKASKKKAAAKKSAARKASTPRFPIANYDSLTVADIRPRLADLSPRQLEAVREREAAGAARKTILKDIDARLS